MYMQTERLREGEGEREGERLREGEREGGDERERAREVRRYASFACKKRKETERHTG